MDLVYPYVVVRFMAAVYARRQLWFANDDPRRMPPKAIAVDKPRPADGVWAEELRQHIAQIVLNEVRKTGFRMCCVFARGDCVYVEPDGSVSASKEPPSGGVQLEPDRTAN